VRVFVLTCVCIDLYIYYSYIPTHIHCMWHRGNGISYVQVSPTEGKRGKGASRCNTPQRTATYCNTLQHTATHCNTLQHTAIIAHCTMHRATTQCNAHKHCSILSLPRTSHSESHTYVIVMHTENTNVHTHICVHEQHMNYIHTCVYGAI